MAPVGKPKQLTYFGDGLIEELQDRGAEVGEVFDEAAAALLVQEQLQLRLFVAVLELNISNQVPHFWLRY